MELAFIRGVSEILLPWVTVLVSAWIAYRVQTTHGLVNHKMDEFRNTLTELSAVENQVSFTAGQQDIRDKTRATVGISAGAVIAAGNATQAAGQAVVAAAALTPSPYTAENNPGRRATDPPRESTREA